MGRFQLDIDDMEELWQIPEGRNCLVNQVLIIQAPEALNTAFCRG